MNPVRPGLAARAGTGLYDTRTEGRYPVRADGDAGTGSPSKIEQVPPPCAAIILCVRRPYGGLPALSYAAAVLVAAGMVATQAEWLASARLAGAVALTTLLPGFALSKILFPGSHDLTLAERLALSIGGSVALVALIAFALDAGPGTIGRAALTIGLPALCLVLGVVAIVRERVAGDAARSRRSSARGDGLAFALVSLGLVVLVTGFWSVLQITDPPAAATEFYLLDESDRLEGYPSSWNTGDRLTVVVGVTSREPEPTRFRIEVAGERTLHTPLLTPGSSWREQVSFVVTPDMAARIPFELYREGAGDEPYRRLYLAAEPGDGRAP